MTQFPQWDWALRYGSRRAAVFPSHMVLCIHHQERRSAVTRTLPESARMPPEDSQAVVRMQRRRRTGTELGKTGDFWATFTCQVKCQPFSPQPFIWKERRTLSFIRMTLKVSRSSSLQLLVPWGFGVVIRDGRDGQRTPLLSTASAWNNENCGSGLQAQCPQKLKKEKNKTE